LPCDNAPSKETLNKWAPIGNVRSEQPPIARARAGAKRLAQLRRESGHQEQMLRAGAKQRCPKLYPQTNRVLSAPQLITLYSQQSIKLAFKPKNCSSRFIVFEPSEETPSFIRALFRSMP